MLNRKLKQKFNQKLVLLSDCQTFTPSQSIPFIDGRLQRSSRVTAYCTASEHNISYLLSLLSVGSIVDDLRVNQVERWDNCAHFSFISVEEYNVDGDTFALPMEAFYFSYGVSVYWGFTSRYEEALNRCTKNLDIGSFDAMTVEMEEFSCMYEQGGGDRIFNDMFVA